MHESNYGTSSQGLLSRYVRWALGAVFDEAAIPGTIRSPAGDPRTRFARRAMPIRSRRGELEPIWRENGHG